MTPAPDDPVMPRWAAVAWRDPEVLLVTGLGSGLLGRAPGTWGTLAALALWWWLLSGLAWPWQLAVLTGTFAVGTWLVHRVCRRYRVHDDPRIVVDEFAGLWLALLGAPVSVAAAVAGFLLFRAFDVLKPWPVSWADRRVPGALGVMLDDLLAGGLAAIVLQLAFRAIVWPLASGGP